MNAFSMSLANPAGLALIGLAIPVVLLHILRPRRQAVTVSSTFLWRAIERPVSRPFDLADVMQRLVTRKQLAGYEVKERFYEIGSHAGLAELEELLARVP